MYEIMFQLQQDKTLVVNITFTEFILYTYLILLQLLHFFMFMFTVVDVVFDDIKARLSLKRAQ